MIIQMIIALIFVLYIVPNIFYIIEQIVGTILFLTIAPILFIVWAVVVSLKKLKELYDREVTL